MAVWNVIEHDELGASAATWTETSIPASYDHLCLKMSMRTDSGTRGYWLIELSGDTTAGNYSWTQLYAMTTVPAADRATSGCALSGTTGVDATADTFATAVLWIPHYANTSNYKQMVCCSGAENASTTNYEWGLMVAAGMWASTAVVDQITLTPDADFLEYSTFTLYGVSGA